MVILVRLLLAPVVMLFALRVPVVILCALPLAVVSACVGLAVIGHAATNISTALARTTAA